MAYETLLTLMTVIKFIRFLWKNSGKKNRRSTETISKLILGFQSSEPYNNGFVEGDDVYIGTTSEGPAAHVFKVEWLA